MINVSDTGASNHNIISVPNQYAAVCSTGTDIIPHFKEGELCLMMAAEKDKTEEEHEHEHDENEDNADDVDGEQKPKKTKKKKKAKWDLEVFPVPNALSLCVYVSI